MWRKRFTDALLFIDRNDVFGREHVVDTRPARRLEDAFRECFGHVALDLFATLSFGAQLRHFQDARKVRSRALRVHALRLLAGGQRVLDDRRKAVLALPDLDVAGLIEDVDGSLARDGRRTGAESQSDFLLTINERCLLDRARG